jgi:hypothetical protein
MPTPRPVSRATTPGDRPQTPDFDLDRILVMPAVEKQTSLSHDTIRRRYPHLLVKLSPRRTGMTWRNVLRIVNGTA